MLRCDHQRVWHNSGTIKLVNVSEEYVVPRSMPKIGVRSSDISFKFLQVSWVK